MTSRTLDDMHSYDRVLVGVDGSGTAAFAAERAIDVACRWRSELHVVDVVPVPSVCVPVGPAGASAIVAKLEDGDRRAGAALEAARCRAAECGVESTVHLVHGEPARAILDTADRLAADLVVVGNRGADAAGHYVLGNVPEAVLLGARCDVLVVHTTDH
jgi:nucleotide-binding universal stress UspA family protein